jgi:hypothetical protein
MAVNFIEQALSFIAFGPQVAFATLTMVPMFADARRASEPSGTPQYLVLDDALSLGLVEITEVSEQGSVPDLRVLNKGAKAVLIVDGEELVGAKQNRVVNLTILVPPSAELTIPVSCVEAGRWRFRSKTFSSAPRSQYATGRAKKMAQVTASMRDVGVHRSDQAQVWHDIAEKCLRLDASSPTSAMEALFTRHADSIDGFVAACRPFDRQVGALFLVAGRVVGFDLFDRPETLRKVLPKLVRSVAIEALDSQNPPDGEKGHEELARLFLNAVAAAPSHSSPAIGLGEDVRISAPGLTGAALAADGGIVHVSAFVV